MLKSGPNKAEAQKFLEFLVSDAAQAYFASGNFEYPVVAGAATPAVLKALGSFKSDPLNVRVLGENQAEAQKIYDRAGWR